MIPRIDYRQAVANRKVKTPEGFKWLQWEFLDDASTLLTGACPVGVYASGKRKGQPNYTGAQTTKCVVTEAEYQAERVRYEAETGRCATCDGDGQEWAGWHHIDGHRFKPCRRCNATGKAPQLAATA